MNNELITAVQGTIRYLENDGKYDWGRAETCQAGIFVSIATGVSQEDLDKTVTSCFWNEMQAYDRPKEVCETTGISVDWLMGKVDEWDVDLGELEALSNEAVLNQMGVQHLDREDRSCVLEYFKAWLELLGQTKHEIISDALVLYATGEELEDAEKLKTSED